MHLKILDIDCMLGIYGLLFDLRKQSKCVKKYFWYVYE